MNKIITFLLLLLSVSINAQKGFKISGSLEGFEENTIVKIQKENLTIDSCYLKHKKFELKGIIEEAPTDLFLWIGDGENAKYVSLFIGNEAVTINAKKQDFPYDVKLKGSKYDDERYEFIQKTKALNIERKELLDKMFLLRDQKLWNDSLQKAYWSRKEPYGIIVKIDQKTTQIQNEFIKNNINSYYALSLLDVYKTEFETNQLNDLLKTLKPEFAKSVYFKSIQNHIKYPDLKIEDKFYDFAGTNQNEKAVKLSDYFKGKYILLDFSTIYCGWCLKAIPKLDEFKNSNLSKLDVVTFYVDKNQKGFEGLIEKHQKDSNVIWDKEGRFSETYAKYKVLATPTFYLFSPEGKLIEKYTGYSEDLGEKITEIISK